MPKVKRRPKIPKVKRAAKKFVSPVTRALDKAGIAYTVLPHKKVVYTAAEIAEQRGRPVSSIVKCIVLADSAGNRVMACVPGNRKVRPALVRDVMGTGKLEFVPEKELRAITGQPLGTTAPVALKTAIPIVIDTALAKLDKLSLSSGNLRFGIELATGDLLRLTGARVATISE